jgi:DNA-directed RNA polymerase specialized sigma24 family protein
MEPQEELVRLVAMQIRLQLDNQSVAIQELSKAGFGPSRIAELVGTTPGTVNVTLAKAKKRKAKKTTTEGT